MAWFPEDARLKSDSQRRKSHQMQKGWAAVYKAEGEFSERHSLAAEIRGKNERAYTQVYLDQRELDGLGRDMFKLLSAESRERIVREYLAALSDASLLSMTRDVLNERLKAAMVKAG